MNWILENLENSLVEVFMRKMRAKVRTSFYLHNSYYGKNPGLPWLNRLSDAKNWLREKEEAHLSKDNIERPSMKWMFKEFEFIDLKVVLNKKPLLGTSPLPDWPRNLAHARVLIALDSFDDNLCVFRCIAVY